MLEPTLDDGCAAARWEEELPGSPPGAAIPRAEPLRADGPVSVRVLVVEDDALVREHAVRLVRRLGYEVRAASGGEDALHLLACDPRCDILFSDVVMPGMSGGQLARRARLLLPDLAIVFVTGHHADPLVEQLRSEGNAVVLAKPYRSGTVADALRGALTRQRR